MIMKAKACKPKSEEFGLKRDGIRRAKDVYFDNNEMQECFLKLKGLVPGLEAEEGKHLSKVDILQSVIDYILDLELTLDFDPLEATRKLCQRPLSESSSLRVSYQCVL